MDNHILKFVWCYSRREQIRIVLLTFLAFPLLYMTLEIPKWIINNALGDSGSVKQLFGVSLQPVPYLVALCVGLMTLIILSGLLKMLINTYKGIIGERLIRRLRFTLMAYLLRFPLRHYANVSPGEMISTISSETEPLAGYIGESIALPLFQGGTMLTILIFMFAQDWVFGVVSLVLIPVQGYLIPKLQKQINMLKKDRIRRVRMLSERIGETVVGATEIRLHGTEKYTLAEFSRRFGDLFWVRLEIFKKKYYMKFLNNTIGQITPFLYYMFGGYLVIKGSLTIGALVAAIAAYKDLTSPWRELLNHYQQHEDAKIKYQQIIALFDVDGLHDEDKATTIEQYSFLPGPVSLSGLGWSDRHGHSVLSNVDLVAEPGMATAIVGGSGKQRTILAQLVTCLIRPAAGEIRFGGTLAEEVPTFQLRTRVSLQGPDPHIFSGTIVENMEYGLNRREPFIEIEDSLSRDVVEAQASGNTHPLTTDWVDYRIASHDDTVQNKEWYSAVIRAIGAENMIYDRSLYERFDPDERPHLADRLLAGRRHFWNEMSTEEMGELVHGFDFAIYNPRLTVLENLLFGAADCGGTIQPGVDELVFLMDILDDCGILKTAVETGYQAAKRLLMPDADLASDDRLITRFGFSDLNARRMGVQSIDTYRGAEDIDSAAGAMFLGVFLQLIQGDHRFVNFDQSLVESLLRTRQRVAADRPAGLFERVVPFDSHACHPGLPVRENIMFGKAASRDADVDERIDTLINRIVEQEGIKTELMVLSGESQVGVGGANLSVSERHTIALGRALMKRPDVLVFYDALSPFEERAKRRLLEQIRALLPALTLIWIDKAVSFEDLFDRVYHFSEEGSIELADSQNT